jgi:GTPase SAR1 family protein
VIDRIVQALAEQMPDSTAEDIADLLWVAALTVATGDPSAGAADDADAPAGAPERPPITDAEPLSSDLAAGGTPSQQHDLVEPGTAVAFTGSTAATTVGLRVPAATDRPDLTARSFAAFRRIRRPGHPVVDVDATVDATADAGRLMLVTRPADERGLDVAVVVDRLATAAVWTDTIAEFEQLLRRSGAFRQVSRWDLVPGARPDAPVRLRDAAGMPHPAGRIVDPTGRRLVLLITDAVAPHWYTTPIWAALQRWASLVPTAIVNVLPEHYLESTALGRPDVAVRARRRAGPNATAEVRVPWWSEDEVPASAVALPVVPLYPAGLTNWAGAVATGSGWVAAIWSAPPAGPPGAEANVHLTAAERVRAFRVRATPAARELARILAASPTLSLPLIRVLQHRLLSSTDPAPVAEIMISGLLERLAGRSDDEQLVFRPDVAPLLRRGATASEDWDAFEVLTEYLEQHAGSGTSVQALLANPAGAAATDAGLTPFAAMGRDVALRLGIILPTIDTPRPAPPGLTPAPQPAKAIPPTSLTYRSTMVVIVGEPATGKTRLAHALIDDTVPPVPSGRAALRCMHQQHLATAGGAELRELWLQEAPRESLLSLPGSGAIIALVVFDARRGPAATERVLHWVSLLNAAWSGRPMTKFLVATWTDQADPGVTSEALDALRRQGRFDGAFGTSARDASGVETLRAAMLEWQASDHTAPFAATQAFMQVKHTVERRRSAAPADDVAGILAHAGEALRRRQVVSALRALETFGHVSSTPTQDMWILDPPVLDDYIQPIMYMAGRSVLGALAEQQVRTGEMPGRPARLHDSRHEQQLWASAVDAVLLSGDAVRIGTEGHGILVFPSLSRPWHGRYAGARTNPVAFTFAGDGRAVFSAIAAWLDGSTGFQLDQFYRNEAIFRDPTDAVCGIAFEPAQNSGGRSSIEVFFGDRTDHEIRTRFAETVHAQLRRYAAPGSVIRDERATGAELRRPPRMADRPRTERAPSVQQSAINVALAGPAASGKTTFLLGILNGSPDAKTYGSWAAIPPYSSSALAEHLYAAARQHAFPDATTFPTDETWIIAGTYPPAPPRKGFRLSRGTAPETGREVRFNLQVVDSPGHNLLTMPTQSIEMLSQSDGLVLLFDPTLMMPAAELQLTDGTKAAEPMQNYLQRTLPNLLRRQLDQGGSAKLPHHLAVCVSKFDDPAVYETARRLGLVDREHDGQPRVASGADAHQLFKALCRTSVEPNDQWLPALIEQYFVRDRISYHVVSSIGFYMDPDRGFVDHDYVNVDARDGRSYIRRLAPANVWEVLIDLSDAVRRTKAAEAVRVQPT